jgi:hypothetical protein
MRIDKNKFPLLFKLREQQDINTIFGITDKRMRHAVDLMKAEITNALDNINYITRPVLEAFDYAPEKTIHKLMSLRNEINTTSRCVLYHNGQNVYTCALYCFWKRDNQTDFFIITSLCNKRYADIFQRKTYGSVIIGTFHKEWAQNNMFGISNFSFTNHPTDPKTEEEYFVEQAELYVQCEVFLQYAELQTKELKPHHKQIEGVKCLYENKLPFTIQIIDSTWYTTLVKTDAFKVRGHFRLQPYGEGLSKKKLVWINEFQKEGYTRTAKKENYLENVQSNISTLKKVI